MEQSQKRFLIRFLTALFVVFMIMAMLFHFFAGRFLIRNAKHEVKEIWEELKEIDLNAYSETSDEEPEELEDLVGAVNTLICDEDHEFVIGFHIRNDEMNVRRYILDHEEEYSENPEVRFEQANSGDPVMLRGILRQEGKVYYVYLARNNHIRLRALKYSERVLGVLLPVLFLMIGLLEWFFLRKKHRPLQEIRRELRELSEGNYTARITGGGRDNDVSELIGYVNGLAETLYYNEIALMNYAYMTKNGGRDRQKLDAMQNKMIGNITHQLKTPLAIISSQVELDHEETDPRKKEYYYRSILEEVDKMSSLISEILLSAKEEKEYASVHLRRTCLSDIMTDMLPKYEDLLAIRRISLDTRIEPDLWVKADPLQIEQIINNFMMNAVSHTRNGKSIRLSCLKEERDCLISVYNEGNGIPEKDIDNIWKGYYQVSPEGKENEIGLGLYIVKQIVIQHGGSCGVLNEGNGVTFWIRLPQDYV